MDDDARIAGTHLDKTFLEDPERPVDQLLRWHFRQAVLANVRGQGEPGFVWDSPRHWEIIDEIPSDPKAREKIKIEYLSWLAESAKASRSSG